MAEEKSVVAKKEKAEIAEAVAAPKPSESPEPVKKAKKPAAKKATPAASKQTKKPAAKKAAVRNELNLDTITTKLWKRFEQADVSGIQDVIAIQVVVEELGIFFIAIKDGEKHIIQAPYYDRDGLLEIDKDEAVKVADGGYDFLSGIESGKLNYQGDLRKALLLLGFFK